MTSEHETVTPTPDVATVFSELVAGHQRYLTGTMQHPHTGHADMEKLAKVQTPKICVLACADSRVPPEVIFDQGLGDMFVVRVAGNFADDDNQASLEYAIQHFDPPPAVIVVLGHERCGAVQAAAISFDPDSVSPESVAKFNAHEHPSEKLTALVGRLKPAIDNTRMSPQPTTDEARANRLDAAVEQNIKDNVAKLQANNVTASKGVLVIGGRYDLDSGEIKWLSLNLAQGATASQSSLASWVANNGKQGTPDLAVDGITDGSFFAGQVTHTNPERNAWWQVDLGSSAALASIVIWNRTDCCGGRLGDYWVFVSDTPFAATDTPATLTNRAETWSNHQTVAPNPATTIAVAQGVTGRYVRVQLTGQDVLSLAEVQVIGVPLSGLPLPPLPQISA